MTSAAIFEEDARDGGFGFISLQDHSAARFGRIGIEPER